MEFRMITSNLVFLLVAAGFSFTFGEKDSLENENPANAPPRSMATDKQKSDSKSKATERGSNFHTRQRKPEYLITPDEMLTSGPRFHYPQDVAEGPAIPHLGFLGAGNQGRNVYFSDHTGDYNLELQSFQPKTATNFQTALGAISAHILNQRNNQEYIPYPPNGNPHDYPAYQGRLRAAEPPAVRAYERATNSYRNAQSRGGFDQANLRRLFSGDEYRGGSANEYRGGFANEYRGGFANEFQSPGQRFYDSPDYFYFQLRRSSEPIHESSWYDLREDSGRPQ